MYEERLRAALEELKALELEEFLSRASKSMDEVHFDKNVHHEGNSEHERSATVPRLADFTDDKTGRTDYIGFLQAVSFYILPRSCFFRDSLFSSMSQSS